MLSGCEIEHNLRPHEARTYTFSTMKHYFKDRLDHQLDELEKAAHQSISPIVSKIMHDHISRPTHTEYGHVDGLQVRKDGWVHHRFPPHVRLQILQIRAHEV